MKTLLTLFSFLPFIAQAQDNIQKEFIDKIISKDVSSIYSDFEQIQELSVLSESQVSSGKFYFINPDKMKWEQIKPSPYHLTFNGNNVYKYDGGEKQKLPLGSPQVAGFRKFIMGTMDGSIFSDKNFTNTFTQNDDIVSIEMIPQKKMLKSRFDKITLSFDFEKMVLLELMFYEKGGDTRLIRFFNHKINTIKDTSIFE